jgi:hypothetical protein
MKIQYKILIFLAALGFVFLVKEIHKRYEYYQAVERFDQIESILRKGQKIDL